MLGDHFEAASFRPVAAVGAGRAVDEGECQISGSQREFNMPGRGAGLLAKAEGSWSRVPGPSVRGNS